MKNKTLLNVSACFAALICATLAVSAAEKKSSSPAPSSSASPAAKSAASPAASPAKQSTRPVPFHGMVSAVDQTAKTFSIAGKDAPRVFKVTDKTTVTKAGKSATMTDIAENGEVSGSYWKAADGSLEAKTVKIGPMSEKKSTDEGKKAKASSSKLPSAAPSASPKASPKP